MDTQNQKKIWFKAKQYGWGWYPATWQGWVSVLVYVMLIIPAPYVILRDIPQGTTPPPLAIVLVLLWYGFLTSALLTVCFKKGERPRWRWGGKGE